MSLLLLFGSLPAGLAQGVTDTTVLQLPINCILAGQQHYKVRGRTWEVVPYKKTENVAVVGAGVRRIRGDAPSFTVKTGTRGYD